MADKQAYGTNPKIALKQAAGTDTLQDYRFERTSSGLAIDRYDGSAWVQQLQYQGSKIVTANDLVLSAWLGTTPTPTLRFQDTGSGGADFRWALGTDGLTLKHGSTTLTPLLTFFKTSYLAAHRGLAAGSTSSTHAIQWRVLPATPLTSGGAHTVTLPTIGKVLAALVQIDSTVAYEFLDHASSARNPGWNGFYVRLERNTSTADKVLVNYDTSRYGASQNITTLVFFQV